MDKESTQLQLYQHYLSFFLPDGILDFFHIMRRCNDAIEEMRLRCKREAQAEVRKEEREVQTAQTQHRRHRGGTAFQDVSEDQAILRCDQQAEGIFRSKTLTKDTARDAIKSREDNVLNYFLNRATNAAAELFNSRDAAQKRLTMLWHYYQRLS